MFFLRHYENYIGGFDKPLEIGTFPSGLTSLVCFSFNQTLKRQVLPSSLRYLCLAHCFQPFSVDVIPFGVVEVNLGAHHLNESVKRLGKLVLNPGDIPESAVKLRIEDCANLILTPGSIPSSVKYLQLPVVAAGIIPNSVTHLELACGRRYIDPIICGVIPPSVTHLRFGKHINSSISSGTIPSSVTHLAFGTGYNSPITWHSCLPSWSTSSCLKHIVSLLCFHVPFKMCAIIDQHTCCLFWPIHLLDCMGPQKHSGHLTLYSMMLRR